MRPRPYAVLPDLYARFGEEAVDQLTDTDGTGTPDPNLVGRAVMDATAEIDLALTGRYALPLSGIPAILVAFCADLAWEALARSAGTVPEAVSVRAKIVRDYLRQIAAGTYLIGDLNPAKESAAAALVEMTAGREHSPFAAPVIRRRT